MSDDLAGWLRTTLDRVERQAKAALWAGDERWEVLPADDSIRRPWQVLDATYDEGLVNVQAHAADDRGVAEHVAFWQPRRVLRLVEATRLILDICEEDLRQRGDGALRGRVDRPTWDVLTAAAVWLADQPGYQEDWKL